VTPGGESSDMAAINEPPPVVRHAAVGVALFGSLVGHSPEAHPLYCTGAYTTGCSEPRESDMCDRELVPSTFLRCEGPTPVP